MQGIAFLPTSREPIPEIFIDYVDYWLEAFKDGTVKKATYSRLVESRRVLESYDIASMPVADITIREIKQYLDEVVEDGYALTTVKKQLQIVTAPLKFAAANRWILTDPTAGLRLPSNTRIKKPAKDITVYEGKQYDKLRALLETRKNDAYCAVLLMIEMGLRPGEVVALDWSDINWNRKTIHIHKTCVMDKDTHRYYIQDEPKTKASNRILPMNEYVSQMMRGLFEIRNDYNMAVFLSCNGDRMSYQALRYQCKEACKSIGIPFKGLHIFRHTFATHQYYKGCSVKILSRILGHASVTVTYNTYIHLYGDALEEMRAAMEGSVKGTDDTQ